MKHETEMHVITVYIISTCMHTDSVNNQGKPLTNNHSFILNQYVFRQVVTQQQQFTDKEKDHPSAFAQARYYVLFAVPFCFLLKLFIQLFSRGSCPVQHSPHLLVSELHLE